MSFIWHKLPSSAQHVLVRTSILALRAITPLSILYCSYSFYHFPQGPALQSLASYAFLETAFYLFVYLPFSIYLQRAARHPEDMSTANREVLFNRCMDTIENPDQYLRKWFRNGDLDEIKRENVKEFLLWAFWNADKPDGVHEEELEKYCDGVEKKLGRKLAPGRGKAKSLRLTLDDVEMLNRPLFWYILIGFLDAIVGVRLLFSGFRFYRVPLRRLPLTFPFRVFSLFARRRSEAQSISYWYRPHTSKTRLPVVFIHGMGIGLYPYVDFLGGIARADYGVGVEGQVGIIALEIMPISARITTAKLSRDDLAKEVQAILDSHGWSKFVLVANSYGTVITSQLLKSPKMAARVGPMLLIDPVVFLLHLPDVAYNVVVRKPTLTNEYVLYYFAAKDMGVAHTLHRRFFWTENILWTEDVAGMDVTVSLAGEDIIVNAPAVGKYLARDKNTDWRNTYLTGSGLEVVWFDHFDHADVFVQKEALKKLVDVIVQYCQKGQPLIDVP
ncbi:hypothetical protein P152DRAFT_453772 [Eremomyces bilateralis CBS 781.70]|uniref:Alpha/beta-hydrolase n=1 Tax=Eremomyces bilateralis CBS 781.70 TaxID=1392243 RepID=A0A6G1GGN5_9PEZI|nr:uncharacterized protein P152DRAFT_453772 [Eremomyces bilateralis CBS 781.70]KAF1817174.1 hypothetical protein P152DRAFT_453772 [Eremomyces bilateralis CBS 781.70]